MSGPGGRKGRRLSEDEHALWEAVTRSVKPLRKRPPTPQSENVEPAPAERPARKMAAIPATAPSAKPATPPPTSLDRRTRQKIARGRHEIEGRLDLHGHTQAEAHAALLRFLRSSQAKGHKLVLVITGKGLRSDRDSGVLRRQVPHWLGLPEFREYVVGFDRAAAAHGGEGALYVRVRKGRTQ
jgi:DNA-nicking Smr family endonuclease